MAELQPGDLVYITDRRWWLGGLRSTHAIIAEITSANTEPLIEMGPTPYATVIPPTRQTTPVRIERLY